LITKSSNKWALDRFYVGVWGWHPAEASFCCSRTSRICMLNPHILVFIVSEISAFIRSDRQAGMARSTWLVILIKNIYTLESRKRFLLPVTYLPLYSLSNWYNYYVGSVLLLEFNLSNIFWKILTKSKRLNDISFNGQRIHLTNSALVDHETIEPKGTNSQSSEWKWMNEWNEWKSTGTINCYLQLVEKHTAVEINKENKSD